MTKKLQERKKQNRKEERRVKMIDRRRRFLVKRKKEREEILQVAAQEKQWEKDFEEAVKQVTPADEFAGMTEEEKNSEIRRRIESNLELLKVLEEEYRKEREDREVLNKQLEEEGCVTMKEKMEFLQAEAAKSAISEDAPENS